jgi:hypothetical protein
VLYCFPDDLELPNHRILSLLIVLKLGQIVSADVVIHAVVAVN